MGRALHGRRDGSPQASLIGYCWDGEDVVLTFRCSSAKYHNVVRQPRVVKRVPDGRTAITVYGDAELVEQHPPASMRTPRSSRCLCAGVSAEEMVRSLDEEDRTILRIHPTSVFLNS